MFRLIIIIEKSKIVRAGLETQLRALGIGKQIASLESLEQLPEVLNNSTPDLILINPDLVRDGTDKIRHKYKLEKKIPFVAVVYLFHSHRELVETFNEIIYITDSEDTIFNKLQHIFNSKKIEPDKNEEQLTYREKDVLRLLLQGLSNKEVADKLSISTHTVISHRKNIIEKTGIRSLSGLAVYAILNNIADMDDLKK